jgi:phenylacetate-CoA ligase
MNTYISETIKYTLRSPLLIFPMVRRIEHLYGLSEEELYQHNERRFLEIFRKAITRSEFYGSLYQKNAITIHDVTSIKDISKLPVIDKKMINEVPKRLLTVPVFGVWKAHTSGTTGAPLTVYEDYFSVLREQAYGYVFRKRRGFRDGEKLVSLRGHLGRDLLKLFVHISNTLYLSSYHINEKTIEIYYREIIAFNPTAIQGYPSSLYNLCLLFKEMNMKLSIPLCFTSSETLFDFQKKLIKEILNTEIYDYYGNTERTISLGECIDHNGYFSQPGYSINEFKNDCIITTSLINASFPLIRYKVDDIVSLNSAPHRHHSELCVVYSIDGRVEDSIIAKDGSLIGRLDFLFKGVENIQLAQVIQKEKGKITINIVPERIFPESERKKLLANIDQRIGLDNIDVNIFLIDDSKIMYTKRNKFRQIISLLT